MALGGGQGLGWQEGQEQQVQGELKFLDFRHHQEKTERIVGLPVPQLAH